MNKRENINRITLITFLLLTCGQNNSSRKRSANYKQLRNHDCSNNTNGVNKQNTKRYAKETVYKIQAYR